MTERNEILKSTKRWYWGGGSVPPAASPQFNRFCGGSMSLVYQTGDGTVRSNVRNGKISYGIGEYSSAYCDISKNAIRLPEWYLKSADVAKLLGIEEDNDTRFFSLVLLNGSTVHETLHLVYSQEPEDMLYEVNRQMKIRTDKRPNRKAAMFVYNILEDLYIESFAQSKLAISNSLVNKNDLLFPEEHFNMAKEKFNNEDNLENLFGLLVFYKKASFRMDKIWTTLPEVVTNALRIASYMRSGRSERVSCDIRAEWIVNVLEALDEYDDKDGGGTTGEDGDESIPGGDAGSEMSVEFATTLEKLVAENKRERLETASEKMEAEEKKEKFEEGRNEAVSRVSGLSFNTGAGVPNIQKFDSIDQYPSSSKNSFPRQLPARKDWGFMRLLKSLRTENRVPGEPRARGNSMVASRLYRIATDSKIMAYNDLTVKKPQGEVEVVILIDASGSMGGSGTSLFAKVTAVARDIFEALRHSNIPTVVYGHTSVSGRVKPSLVKAAAYRMNSRDTADAKKAFADFSRIRLYENFDGYAISEAAKAFSNRPSRKVFISLSDGTPCGTNYSGSEADNHTKDEIKKLRDTGILVFCMSLVPAVMRSNSRIYGETYNIDASKNVQGQFEKLVQSFL